MKLASSFACGLLFGLGLGISGMTQPAKIIAFLDVTGNWDPSLVFVMGGAVAVSFVLFALILERPAPVLASRFHLPEKKPISGALIGGAATFGVGWGLSGFCPGPALVSLVTARPSIVVFVASMGVGLALGGRLKREPRANPEITLAVSHGASAAR